MCKFTKYDKRLLWDYNFHPEEVFKYSKTKKKVDGVFEGTRRFPRRPDLLDSEIYKQHIWQRTPNGQDGIKLGNEFGYSTKFKIDGIQKFFETYEENYVDDIRYCHWCASLGFEPYHSITFFTNYGGTESFRHECLLMRRYKNAIRETTQLKGYGRLKEDILRIWRKSLNETVLTKENLDEEVYRIYGEMCFLCGSFDDLAIDHIFPLDKLWPQTLKNSIPLCKKHNSKKKEQLPSKFYKLEDLIRLSKLPFSYTLQELQTETYNFPFVIWFNDEKNKDKIYEYVQGRGKSEQYWNSLIKTIDKANKELKNINGTHLF